MDTPATGATQAPRRCQPRPSARITALPALFHTAIRWVTGGGLACSFAVAWVLASGGAIEAQISPQATEIARSALEPRELGRVWLVSKDGGGTRIPQPSIQAAVDAASEGDTVLLSDGLFRGPGNRGVVVSGKNVRIESENGPERCVIDCQSRDRGFFFTGSQVTAETILRGVTIVRGFAPDVVAPPAFGGGVFVNFNSLATIEDCVIVGCIALGGGGGIGYNRTTLPRGIVRDCLIVDNHTNDSGGGIRGFSLLVERCTILENTAGSDGGGAELQSNALIRDSVIARNRAENPFSNPPGGGLRVDGAARVESCTIVDNVAKAGGGIACGSGPNVVISNSILWGNLALNGLGHQFWQGLAIPGLNNTLRFCDIEGGPGGVASVSPGMPELISILDVDPVFVDRQGGDYHLTSHSPLIGAGDPSLSPGPTEGDLEGEPRAKGLLDIGADEHYDGLALAFPAPGRAGEMNTLSVRGARAGELVFLFAGVQAGRLDLSFGACPTLALEIEDGALVTVLTPDGQGAAQARQAVPAAVSGIVVHLQAVGFDPSNAAAGCIVSNLVSFPFP